MPVDADAKALKQHVVIHWLLQRRRHLVSHLESHSQHEYYDSRWQTNEQTITLSGGLMPVQQRREKRTLQ